MRAGRALNVASLLSALLLGLTLALWAGAFVLNPWDNCLSITRSLHVGLDGKLDGRLVFFNDPVWSPGVARLSVPDEHTAGWDSTYGVYARYSTWPVYGVWAVAISLGYPLVLFSILPLIWLWRLGAIRCYGGRAQFELRLLFYWIGLVALFLSLARSIGCREAIVVFAEIFVLACAARCRRAGRPRASWLIVMPPWLGLMWMTVVDGSWFIDRCDHCLLDRDMVEYRAFFIPLHSRSYPHFALPSRVAEDLGRPCPHRFDRFHKIRWWGLFHPARPLYCGIDRLTCGDERNGLPLWYDDRTTDIVRAFGESVPGLGDEYLQRALLDHDWSYRNRVFCVIRASRMAAPDPPPSLVKWFQEWRDHLPLELATRTTPTLTLVRNVGWPLCFEGDLWPNPAEFTLSCPACRAPIPSDVRYLVWWDSCWRWKASEDDARRIARVFDLPVRQERFGEDWGAHDGNEAAIAMRKCPNCANQYLVYFSYRRTGRDRYAVTLQAMARVPVAPPDGP